NRTCDAQYSNPKPDGCESFRASRRRILNQRCPSRHLKNLFQQTASAEVVAYAGLNPRRHQSGTCIDRATRISKIGNAVLRAALYMPALSAMRYNSAIVALVTRLKSRGRLKPKQIVVAAMRKLLVL